MRRMSILVAVAVLLALAMGACGGPAGPSTSIRVTMTDFAFSPNAFTVPAGESISVEINNNGAVAHSFLIMEAGQQVQAHFTEADKANVFWEQAMVPPGESVKGSFTAPTEPGEYQIVCGISGHFEAGMVAKLVVVKQ